MLDRSPSSNSLQSHDIHNLYKISNFQVKQNWNITSEFPEIKHHLNGNQGFQNDPSNKFENKKESGFNLAEGFENKTFQNSIEFLREDFNEKFPSPEIDIIKEKNYNLRTLCAVATSYKNFGISYQENQQQPNIIPLNQLMNENNKNKERIGNDSNYLNDPESSVDFQNRILLKNPGIGDLIIQSSKYLDQVHKMLEQHRMKTAEKVNMRDSFESSFSSQLQDPCQLFNSEFTEESKKQEEINFQLKKKSTNSYMKLIGQDSKNKFMEFDKDLLSLEELQKNEEKSSRDPSFYIQINDEKELIKNHMEIQNKKSSPEIKIKRDDFQKIEVKTFHFKRIKVIA